MLYAATADRLVLRNSAYVQISLIDESKCGICKYFFKYFTHGELNIYAFYCQISQMLRTLILLKDFL